jgi:hypothetical protein
VVDAGDAGSGEDLVKLSRAAEDLLSQKRTEEDEVAALLTWARAQPRSRLAEELDYDLSDLLKVLAGKIRPKRLIKRMFNLRDYIARGSD